MSCPALHVLRGTMGTLEDGTPVEPACDYPAPGEPCGHCHTARR